MGIIAKDSDFYSLHGIWGAYGTLALGKIGRGAGLVVGNVQPPMRGMYVGYREGNATPKLLPFVPNVKVGLGADAFVADEQDPAATQTGLPPRPILDFFAGKDIVRELSMSGESWSAGRLRFTVTSFFGSVPDPAKATRAALRAGMCPAIYARLSFDNTDSKKPLVGVFGMQGVRRPLSDVSEGKMLGFAHIGDWGFAALPADDISEAMDWMSLPVAFGDRPEGLRRLAADGSLRFEVPAGARREYLIALGVYREGLVTTGMRARAFHSGLFRDLDEALEFALENAQARLAEAARLDAELDAAPISDDRKFLIAHAAHSYNASSELLADEAGVPVYVVNEGEYQMMNTLDLTVDQTFHELAYSPWTIGNELDFFLARYSYRDKYGIAFTHDQGVIDCFTPKGSSSYELPNLKGCFSFMSYEETLNWLLTACLYAENGDDPAWIARNRAAFVDAVNSVLARDANGDGIMDADSPRCQGGSEITTYDSLDVSLGQARNNLYIAVKAWATLICSAKLLDTIGAAGGQGAADCASLAASARISATRAADTVLARVSSDGHIPAVFEGGNDSKIIPAVEGLLYPAFCGVAEAVSANGPWGKLVAALRRHLDVVLVPGVCLDSVSGGWKLSSTSRNTWLSKIFIGQYVAENILGIKDERTARDAAHVAWQCNGSADWAATDQVDSATGKDLGSRLYPRLVSSILWYKKPTKK